MFIQWKLISREGRKVMRNNLRNEKGFTLVEVLLSIILLSIILTSFFVFFTQSAKTTLKNGQKLSTLQVAELIIHMIDSNVTIDKLKVNTALTPVSDTSGHNISGRVINDSEIVISNYVTTDNDNTAYYVDGKDNINRKFNISIDTDYNVYLLISKNIQSQMIQAKVTVKDPVDPSNKSETFTYIRR